MRILILDSGSNCLDLAMRCQMAGHKVLWYDQVKGAERSRAGDGIIEKIHDFNEVRRKWIDAADLIYIPDNVAYVTMLEPYRLKGYPIFNSNLQAARLELDRNAGQEAYRKAGIQTIPGREFRDYKEAIRYVEKENKPFVSKPSGDADKALSYVASGPDDMIYMLERWSKNPDYARMAKKDGFILQEKIDGIEMAVGGYFGPHGWNEYFFENFEYKKLMAGDMGVNTGEMGTTVSAVKKSKLADLALIPFTKQLEALNYCGFVDSAVMIGNDGKINPMELTISRDGWPIRHNIQSLLEDGLDPAQWMLDLVNGIDSMRCKDEISISIIKAIPPFPYKGSIVGKITDGIPMYDALDMDHVHLSEARMAPDVPTQVGDKVVRIPGIVTSGEYTCVITGTGSTITAARTSAYTAAKKVRIPNSPFFRPDIGVGRLKKQLPVLHKLGFAKSFSF